MKKWIAGIIIVVIIGGIFINWRLSLSPNNEDCTNATEPQMIVPIQVFEGSIYSVQICGVEDNHEYHVYLLKENDYTFSRTYTGKTHYVFPMNPLMESDFEDDGTLKIFLFDITTQTIVDQKIILLIRHCGFCGEPFMFDLMIPILIIALIFGVVVAFYRWIEEKRNSHN